MSQTMRIVYNGREAEISASASYAEDLPLMLRNAAQAVDALLAEEEGGEEVCTRHVATEAAAPAGFQANGQVIAAIGALVQKAIAAAPALIAEIQTLEPEIAALIALFGKTPASAA